LFLHGGCLMRRRGAQPFGVLFDAEVCVRNR
jgi:hypothetical protein